MQIDIMSLLHVAAWVAWSLMALAGHAVAAQQRGNSPRSPCTPVQVWNETLGTGGNGMAGVGHSGLLFAYTSYQCRLIDGATGREVASATFRNRSTTLGRGYGWLMSPPVVVPGRAILLAVSTSDSFSTETSCLINGTSYILALSPTTLELLWNTTMPTQVLRAAEEQPSTGGAPQRTTVAVSYSSLAAIGGGGVVVGYTLTDARATHVTGKLYVAALSVADGRVRWVRALGKATCATPPSLTTTSVAVRANHAYSQPKHPLPYCSCG